MDKASVALHREKLLKCMPEVTGYISNFQSINKRWGMAITTALIETGHMARHVSTLFAPLIQEMSSTKTKYGGIQKQLVDAILFEMVKKVVAEISDAAKFAINILKRNLFERTADVGYLATDAEIVNFLKMIRNGEDAAQIQQKSRFIRNRLKDYQHEYTVYNEIIVLDASGYVQANLDEKNRVIRSTDSLLALTQAVDLHSDLTEDKYIETFRETDLRPGHGHVLIYSQKIEDPETRMSLGTLCLCFDFEDEMERIFTDLLEGNDRMIVGILNKDGRVLCSSQPDALSLEMIISVDLEASFKIIMIQDCPYLYNMAATDGYQGFFGLPWYGVALIRADAAFDDQESQLLLDKSMNQKLQNFSAELSNIKKQSEELLGDMKIDSLNGQINAAKSDAKAFVEVLRFIEGIGAEIDGVFTDAIENLQQTVIASLFHDVEFRAFQGNNVADRNLYERANDVCWWALTPLFRSLMTKHLQQGLTETDLQGLTENLQYINDLYTPYLRLVLADTEGVVIATSNPPAVLEERFVESSLPQGQGLVGMKLDFTLVNDALHLPTTKDYCVSEFVPSPLYGGRPTYIYSTAVRDPEDTTRPVGVIQIVFDSEPQFRAMLTDTLPKDDQQIRSGAFGIFADREKNILSSTDPDYPVGSTLDLDDALFQGENGERTSTLIELNSRTYSLGIQVSHGYREYKQNDGYVNDMICLIFVPL